jgi:hypothetical protein
MKQLTIYALILVLAIFSGCEYNKGHDHDDHSHDDSDSTASTLNR